jgi:hypothetical protein
VIVLLHSYEISISVSISISTPKKNESKTISSLHLMRLHHVPPLRLCASSPVPPSAPPSLAHSPMPQAQLSRGQVDTPSTPRSRHPRLLAPPPDAITSALVAPSFLPPRPPTRSRRSHQPLPHPWCRPDYRHGHRLHHADDVDTFDRWSRRPCRRDPRVTAVILDAISPWPSTTTSPLMPF